MGRLDGKVAIVTGAARGTGETTARLFVREGARVLLADVRDEPGEALAKELGAAACYRHMDVGSEEDWLAVIADVRERFGRLDVLVNNAAVLHIAALPDTELSDYERIVRTNQTGTFLGMKHAAGALREAGGGSIVNVSSIDGLRGMNGVVAYAASKWAVRGMTRVAAIELGKWGIRVNAVCPEAGSPFMIEPWLPPGVDLEQATRYTQPFLAYQKERSSAEKIGDVANVILFLASDESASCTGADFAVDGGNSAGRREKFVPGA